MPAPLAIAWLPICHGPFLQGNLGVEAAELISYGLAAKGFFGRPKRSVGLGVRIGAQSPHTWAALVRWPHPLAQKHPNAYLEPFWRRILPEQVSANDCRAGPI